VFNAGDAAFAEHAGSVRVDRFGHDSDVSGKECGLGSDCGTLRLPSGAPIAAGRLLMRDTWNAALYPPLDVIYRTGAQLPILPDVLLHKNRMSGLWGGGTACEAFLKAEGITTLFFAGVNTDQCVGGTLTDAFSKGFDCVLLGDGCGTTSPGEAQRAWEWNAERTFGFCMGCRQFAGGVGS
jgi:nicotinamidase-related amidase